MMDISEYAQYDGVGLAELVRTKDVTPEELTRLALQGVAKVNPKINAVIETYGDLLDGMERRRIPQGPFGGVPFLRKDLGLTETGRLLEIGSRLTKGVIPDHDSYLWTRFLKAGLVNLGRSTTPEFGLIGVTESALTGVTRNPWNLEVMAGGSSGGGAASVAAGIVPVAHASDGGGSIRIPASCCGLVGLKPTRGRISMGPDRQESLFGFAVEFIVSRSVRDTAAMLDAVRGPEPGDPFIIAPPERPYVGELHRPLGRLRIAYSTKTVSPFPLDPEVVKAVESIAAKCEEMGHRVEEAAPKYDYDRFMKADTDMVAVTMAARIPVLAAALKREVSPDYLEPGTLSYIRYGQQLSATEFAASVEEIRKFRLTFGLFFQDYDLLLMPTLGLLPQPHGPYNLQRDLDLRKMYMGRDAMFQCTPQFNATGQPAISLPLCQSKSGLPIGIQFAARLGDEATLIRLGRALEEALPWKDRRPPVHVGARQ